VSFLGNKGGATSLEYCFIACLISIVAITAMMQIGNQTLANTSSVLTGFAR
jgi:Flp pilus assembly pilin Flp